MEQVLYMLKKENLSMKNKIIYLIRQVKYDCRRGFSFTWKRYAFLFMIIIFFDFYIMKRVIDYEQINKISLDIGFWDYLFQIFQGMPANMEQNKISFFELPAMWLLFHLYLIFCLSGFLQQEEQDYGQQVLIRTKSRGIWWLGKCCWYLVGTAVYYGITFSVTAVFAYFRQGFRPGLSVQLQESLSHIDVRGIEDRSEFIIIVIMPLIVSMGLVLFQLLVSAIFNPMISIIVQTALFAISGYFCTPFLPGNYLMLMRLSEISGEKIKWEYGIGYGLVLIGICFLAGRIYYNRKDLFGLKHKQILFLLRRGNNNADRN